LRKGGSIKECNAAEGGNIKFYAFKSDVPHSISEVTSGYRVVIIWKLRLVNKKTFKKQALDYIKRRSYLSESDLSRIISQQRERDETVEKGLREGKRIFRLKD